MPKRPRGVLSRMSNLGLNVGNGVKRVLQQLSPSKARHSPRKKARREEDSEDENLDPSVPQAAGDHDEAGTCDHDVFLDPEPGLPTNEGASFYTLDFGLPPSPPTDAPPTLRQRMRLADITAEPDDASDRASITTISPPRPPHPLIAEDETPDDLVDAEDLFDLRAGPQELEADDLHAAGLDHHRPSPPQSFLDRMKAHSERPGYKRTAPDIAAAQRAALDLAEKLRGPTRGKCRGYKVPNFDRYTRLKLEAIHAFLNMYASFSSVTYGRWSASAKQTATAAGRGDYFAECVARMARQYIEDRNVLPINPFGKWSTSMLADEDLSNEILLHLQSLGNNITAEKLANYLRREDIREKYQIGGHISVRTAQRYLFELGYR